LLPQRLRTLAPEMVKFGIIGGLNVVVNWVAFNILLLLPLFANGQLKAKVIATGIAIVSSYFMNRHWTYKDRDKSAAHREFVLFLGFNLAGMLIELAVMAMTKYVFGLTSWLAINVAFIVGLALGTVFRFFTYRTWVFTHADEAPEVQPRPAAVAMGLDAEGFDELTADLERELTGEQPRIIASNGFKPGEREVAPAKKAETKPPTPARR
jgi:putative flippase GtrA